MCVSSILDRKSNVLIELKSHLGEGQVGQLSAVMQG